MDNKKTKILYLITGSRIGGAESMVRDLVVHLNRDQYEAVVVSIEPKKELAFHMERLGIRVISLNAKSKYNPSLIFSFVKLLRQEKPDIIHTHLFHADILGRIIGRIMGIPIVSSIHNVTFGGKFREMILRMTKKLVNMSVAIAQVVYDHALAIGIADKNKLSLIYDGVDMKKFLPGENKGVLREKLHLDAHKKIIVSTGRLIEQKGFSHLGKAVQIVHQNDTVQNLQVIILGEGPLRATIEQAAEELPPEMVVLAGNVSNVHEYLAAADLFVMASLWEGFSLAVVEAGATGLPVIATDVGIAPELITYTNGIMVPAGDDEQLARAIVRVFSMAEDERRQLGNRLRADVEQRFSAEHMTREYETLYSKVLTGRAPII